MRGKLRPSGIGLIAANRPAKGMGELAAPVRWVPVVAAGTIRAVAEDRTTVPPDPDAEVVAQLEESRLLMMRRVKAMSVEERVALFERLSRDAAWVHTSVKRVR